MLLKRPRLKPWKLSLKVWYTSVQVLTCINMWKFWLHACLCSSLNWFYGEICVCNLVLHAVQANLRKRLNIWQKQFLSILHQQSCMPQEVHYHCFFFCKVSCWSYGSCMNEICLYNFLYVVNIVNLWCFTATVYIKMKKPNAAIRDANAALEVVVCPIYLLFWHLYII